MLGSESLMETSITSLNVRDGAIDVDAGPVIQKATDHKSAIQHPQVGLATRWEGAETSVFLLACSKETEDARTIQSRKVVSKYRKGYQSGVSHDEVWRVVFERLSL